MPDAPSRPGLRIGEAAGRLGLTARTLRYWEERGLVPPAERTNGGFRSYGDTHLAAAHGIQRMRAAGFGLDEIIALQGRIRRLPTALSGMHEVSRAFTEQEGRLRARIAEAQELLAELEAARRCAGLCTGCQGKQLDTACIACLDEASGSRVPRPLESLLRGAARPTPE